MKTLIVGDIDKDLPDWANKYHGPCELLDNNNYSNANSNQNFYTSLADLGRESFFKALLSAERIIYHPPKVWSNSGLQKDTEDFLRFAILNKRISIENYTVGPDEHNMLTLIDDRKSEDPQVWVLGCSLSHGDSLEDIDLRFGQLVADHYNKPVTFLTETASSIPWAADQILRSDVRRDDLVIWHITELHRYNLYRNNQQIPITMTNLELMTSSSLTSELINHVKNITNKFGAKNKKHVDIMNNMTDFLEHANSETLTELKKITMDENRLLESVKAIYQVKNYCDKIGAKLVMFGVIYIPSLTSRSVETFTKYLVHLDDYIQLSWLVDTALDGLHPGVETQKLWAKEVIDFIEKRK